VVRLPLKMDPTQLGSSRLMAEQQMHATERRLDRAPDLKLQYHNFMREYEELGHMEPVPHEEGKQTCYFLPHHPVFKETSTTTKTRVVFDGSAKTSNGLSLNHILQVGPNVQQDLYSIVLRFRTLLYPAACRIRSKVYRGCYPRQERSSNSVKALRWLVPCVSNNSIG